MEKRVLLISSDLNSASEIIAALQPLGFDVTPKQKLSSGLKAMKDGDIVLLDIPDLAASMKEIKSYHPDASVIALADSNCKGRTLESGAYFCLEKPFSSQELRATVRNAFHYSILREELDRLKGGMITDLKLGKGSKMLRVLTQIEKASRRDVPVLITGERGAGREYVAWAIHGKSARRHHSFVTVEASPESLDTELFGTTQSAGSLVRAEGGTLFIKNMDNIPQSFKSRLSEFLKNKKCGNVKADVRIICSVNGSLKKDPLLASFGALLSLPPLRERTEDIVPLAEHFLKEASDSFGLGEKNLSKDARKTLLKYEWPGNVKELKKTVTIACLISGDSQVETRHLAAAEGSACYSIKEFLDAKLGKYLKEMAKLRNSDLYGTVMSEVEKSLIELVLKETNGNQVKASGVLGITRTTLRNKIKGHKIKLK